MTIPPYRILLGIFTAVSLTVAVILIPPHRRAQASPLAQDTTPPAGSCASCHPEVQAMWYAGAHSSARTVHVLEESSNCVACHPVFQGGQGVVPPPAGFASSTSDGKMQDAACMACHTTGYDPATNKSASYGVTCESCHPPVADHPNKDIATNTDTALCGRCHSDSRFNWDNWQNSRHYRENMNCVECHDPHSTSLQHVGTDPAANKSALCVSCHEPNDHMSPYSVHGRAGVTCENCHVGEKSGVDTFHVVPNHSFKPQIATCNKCHAATLHQPAKPSEDLPAAVSLNPTPTPFVAAEAPHANAGDQSTENDAAAGAQKEDNSWNWLLWLVVAGLAGLIGLIVGIAVPELQRLLRSKKPE